ncbi:hypothetical protein PSECIP111854_03327 [Pseudoalteromonas sp. CIP111854]|uniref:Lysozyme n=1 Tax=Pseudoalteromonas holothuriae TaxID=2963714 RepID=A0A9W4R2C8_9GAMM|nr:glycoside hydrolase family 25 protein [Pseudoalteromonas sp. CIP111854]CAH9063954.1 hypothetical protein PSECIP111854_03327 [Pseudoalteromonas sp. CIP111854]
MNYKLLTRLAVLFIIVIICIKRPILFETFLSSSPKTEFTDGIHGIDVSHDQGQVNWHKVAQSGIQFVYLKATDGMTYTDPKYSDNLQGIQATNLAVGAYHFFEAEDDPQKQLAHFLAHIKGKGLTLTPMVDVELLRAQSAAQIKTRLNSFLTELEQQIGCKPLIYSYGSFWQANIGTGFNDYPFWFAQYNKTMQPPEKLKNIKIWQYSERGSVPGIDTPVDLDKVLDTEQGLEALKCNY